VCGCAGSRFGIDLASYLRSRLPTRPGRKDQSGTRDGRVGHIGLGQGFWLATKRLSKGRFRWWPTGAEPARKLRAHQAPPLAFHFWFCHTHESIVSICAGGWKIALYFTGWKHAGENLADVLKQRARKSEAPIQMCDALARNSPKLVETLLANCLAHGRRQFTEVADSFPDECRYVLESLGAVYGFDAEAKERGLTAEERLTFHQTHSAPVMEDLHQWMEAQFAEHKTEPNSGLGKAISYLLRHWVKLTLFLRQAGAPLDNNVVERALKKAILHRKNALFYRTMNGARVGDLFMSLIHTCELNRVNPFDYLTALLRHPAEVAVRPAEWMPWNYRRDAAAVAA